MEHRWCLDVARRLGWTGAVVPIYTGICQAALRFSPSRLYPFIVRKASVIKRFLMALDKKSWPHSADENHKVKGENEG